MRVPAVILLGLSSLAVSAPATPPRSAKLDERAFQHPLKSDARIAHALDRLTFGPRPGDIARVKRMGLPRWVDQQLHPERIVEAPSLDAKLQPLESLRMSQAEAVRHYPPPAVIAAIANGKAPLPEDPAARAAVERQVERYRARKDATGQNGDDAATPKPNQSQAPVRQAFVRPPSPEQRRDVLLARAPQQVVAYDLAGNKIYRAIYSNRQLQELLVDFWYNHFNVFLDKGADRFMVPSYERDAIRPHVLGNFRDLLEATATSPAMMFYLDNWQSVGADAAANRGGRARRGLNENYARELMELHTLGVDGGYTQKDVTEVARCFTGWTIKAPRLGGGFEYNDRMHDNAEKIVLGVVIPAGGGREDGEKVLDILARHPSTARFISRELARRFVADSPPDSLAERMAREFQKSDGDIRSVMRVMLSSKEFWSEGAYRAKVKTPLELVASAVRALDADVVDAFPLANQIARLGEPLYRKLEPTGYKSANAEWVNSAALVARMNFALALANNKVQGVKVDVSRFSADPLETARVMLFAGISPETQAAIADSLAKQQDHNSGPPAPATIAGLVLGSPEFQRR